MCEDLKVHSSDPQSINSLSVMDVDIRPFFNQLRSIISSDVGIWTQVTYSDDYESSALWLQH